ncbi:MAG: hypothetical protein KAS38_19110, partial [Anaerolineales bacterium]|nr:hypothetical protein [Anaerolineales bacterium]
MKIPGHLPSSQVWQSVDGFTCSPRKKALLTLVGGATVAMWIVAIGRWIIVPVQSWPMILESER